MAESKEDALRALEKPKEITIKFNTNQLIKGGYILLVLALVCVIGYQQYYGNILPSSCSGTTGLVVAEKESDIVGPIVEETVLEEEPEEETPEEVVEEEPEEDLPITGDIFFTIDEVNHIVKGDDYARIMSVTFTIKNQDEDFTPKVKGFLTYDQDDIKQVELSELEAGKSTTYTSTELTFGYDNIDNEKILKLELYDNKKLIKTITKSAVFN